MKTLQSMQLFKRALFLFVFTLLILSCEKKDNKPYATGPDIYVEVNSFKPEFNLKHLHRKSLMCEIWILKKT